VIGIRVGQDDVFESCAEAEMLSQMGDDLVAGIGGAAVDQHQLEVDRRAVAQDDGVSGFAAGAHRHEFDFADHLTPPSLGAA
jgi:hypothetical protein